MLATVSFESDLLIVALFLIKTLNNFKALFVEGEIKCAAIVTKHRNAKLLFRNRCQSLRLLLGQKRFLSLGFFLCLHSILQTLLEAFPCIFLL